MTQTIKYLQAIERLKTIYNQRDKDQELCELLSFRDKVLERYQPLFMPASITRISEKDFSDFLLFKNNRHWPGLKRSWPKIKPNFIAAREALSILVDEEKPISKRMDALSSRGQYHVDGLGKATLTAILFVAYPDKYGVWNGTSEGAMVELEIWPSFEPGLSIGKCYESINEVILGMAKDLNTNFWTLDALWWRVLRPCQDGTSLNDISLDGSLRDQFIDDSPQVQFGIERHLQDFLLDNWEHTKLGKEWNLVEEDDEVIGYGYERITDIGKIDLLAKHKTETRWLVIELKRSQATDDTVGQVLRYMGWVKKHLAKEGDIVEGLIISLDDDQKLRYALEAMPTVKFMRYEIRFHLVESNEKSK